MFQTLFRLSDNALSILLQFFQKFLLVLCKVCNIQADKVNQVIQLLPNSVFLSRNVIGRGKDPFRKYVCCPSCRCLYDFEECTVIINGKIESKECTHVAFPNHPQKPHRKPCSEVLMQRVRSPSGKVLLHPRSVFCYRSVIDSLQDLLRRPLFQKKCELWQNWEALPGLDASFGTNPQGGGHCLRLQAESKEIHNNYAPKRGYQRNSSSRRFLELHSSTEEGYKHEANNKPEMPQSVY